MRTFLNHIKNETLDEMKISLKKLWQRMIQLSEFFQYSFVLILKRKCLVRARRVRCGESGIPSTIIYTRRSSRRYELGCDAPVIMAYIHGYAFCIISGIGVLINTNDGYMKELYSSSCQIVGRWYRPWTLVTRFKSMLIPTIIITSPIFVGQKGNKFC